jgi:hypothetical protein
MIGIGWDFALVQFLQVAIGRFDAPMCFLFCIAWSGASILEVFISGHLA